jgi:hypothetical protein
MGEARFENLETGHFDDTRFASMIRKSLHEVVEATLARVPATAERREDIRAAGERLGNALVAHTEVPDPPQTSPSRAAANEGRQPSGGESDTPALAFRRMAGVRR